MYPDYSHNLNISQAYNKNESTSTPVAKSYVLDRYIWQDEIDKSNLSGPEKAIAIHLSRYLNQTKDFCHPTQELIALKTGYCISTVEACIKKLEAKNWIRISKHRKKGQKHLNNGYTICIPENVESQRLEKEKLDRINKENKELISGYFTGLEKNQHPHEVRFVQNQHPHEVRFVQNQHPQQIGTNTIPFKEEEEKEREREQVAISSSFSSQDFNDMQALLSARLDAIEESELDSFARIASKTSETGQISNEIVSTTQNTSDVKNELKNKINTPEQNKFLEDAMSQIHNNSTSFYDDLDRAKRIASKTLEIDQICANLTRMTKDPSNKNGLVTINYLKNMKLVESVAPSKPKKAKTLSIVEEPVEISEAAQNLAIKAFETTRAYKKISTAKGRDEIGKWEITMQKLLNNNYSVQDLERIIVAYSEGKFIIRKSSGNDTYLHGHAGKPNGFLSQICALEEHLNMLDEGVITLIASKKLEAVEKQKAAEEKATDEYTKAATDYCNRIKEFSEEIDGVEEYINECSNDLKKYSAIKEACDRPFRLAIVDFVNKKVVIGKDRYIPDLSRFKTELKNSLDDIQELYTQMRGLIAV